MGLAGLRMQEMSMRQSDSHPMPLSLKQKSYTLHERDCKEKYDTFPVARLCRALSGDSQNSIHD